MEEKGGGSLQGTPKKKKGVRDSQRWLRHWGVLQGWGRGRQEGGGLIGGGGILS